MKEKSMSPILKSVQIQTQSFCNGRCVMCPYSQVVKKLNQGEIPVWLFEKITSELLTDFPRLETICLTLQNEPLLDENLPEKISFIVGKRKKKKFPKVSLVTNGLLLGKETSRSLVNSGLDRLTVSLNAITDKTYQKINKKGSATGIINNLNSLASIKTKQLMVIVRFLLLKPTMGEIFSFLASDLRNNWEKRGFKFEITPFVNTKGLINAREQLLAGNGINRFLLKYRKGQRVGAYCTEPFYKLNILFNGDVLFCSFDWYRANVIGNVKQTTIRDILEGEQLKALKEGVIAKKYHLIEACRNCSLPKLYF